MPRNAEVHARTFRAFGVTVTVRVGDPVLLAAVDAVLPPGHTPASPADAIAELGLAAASGPDALDAELRASSPPTRRSTSSSTPAWRPAAGARSSCRPRA